MPKKLTRVERPFTALERERLAKIRAAAMNDLPRKSAGARPAALGLGTAIRAACEA